MYLNISDIRRINTQNLQKENNLDRRGLAKKTGLKYAQLGHYIGRNPSKNIGDKTARTIEEVFSKPKNWLDHQHNELPQCPIDNIPMSEVQQPSNDESETPMSILKKLLNSDESFLIERYRSLPTDKKHALINFIGDDKDNTEPNNKTVNNSVINSPHSKNEFNNSIG